MHPLYTHIHTQYAEFLNRIRQHHQPRYDWLHPKNTPFILQPDYLKLTQFNTKTHSKIINQSTAKWPTVWAKIVWPRVLKIIQERFQNKYFGDIEHNYPHVRLHETDTLLQALTLTLTPGHPHLTMATYTDLYYFLNEILKGFCNYLDIPADVYGPTKAKQTQECLKMVTRIKEDVLTHPQAFEIAAFLCIKANWIDCVEDHVHQYFD